MDDGEAMQLVFLCGQELLWQYPWKDSTCHIGNCILLKFAGKNYLDLSEKFASFDHFPVNSKPCHFSPCLRNFPHNYNIYL